MKFNKFGWKKIKGLYVCNFCTSDQIYWKDKQKNIVRCGVCGKKGNPGVLSHLFCDKCGQEMPTIITIVEKSVEKKKTRFWDTLVKKVVEKRLCLACKNFVLVKSVDETLEV